MEKTEIKNQEIIDVDYTKTVFSIGNYENCTFKNCNFNSINLSQSNFTDCTFQACDLSLTNLNGTGFKTVRLVECKVIGVRFEGCNPFLFKVDFVNSQLNYSTFIGNNLGGTEFNNCQLIEVDFSLANLDSATFKGCDLSGVIFSESNLTNADLREAHNFRLDLDDNKVHKAKFSRSNIEGILSKYNLKID